MADRILITGGAGFIGSHLADALLSSGYDVRVLDNFSRSGSRERAGRLRAGSNAIEIVVGDVRSASDVCEALKGVSHVYHLAAQVAVTSSLADPFHDFDVNANGTLVLLDAIRNLSRMPTVIFTSTNKVYGDLRCLELVRSATRYVATDSAIARYGVSELAPIELNTPYACSKGTADAYVLGFGKSFGLRCAVLRLSCIYGPRQSGSQDQGWVSHIVRQAISALPITVFGDGYQVRDLLYVDDLIEALILTHANISALDGRAFNLGGGPGNAISVNELIGALPLLTGMVSTPSYHPWRQGDQRFYISDTRAFTAAVNWTPTTTTAAGLACLYDSLRHLIQDEDTAVRDGST